jgi:hypothetical protein
MLNPALMAAITANAATQYRRTSGDLMPWPLAFLVAPLVLHKSTREALPRDTRTHLATWVASNPTLYAGFAPRAAQLRDAVLEGIRFGLRYGALTVANNGGLDGELAGGVVDATGKLREAAAAKYAGEVRVVAVMGEGTDLGQVVQKAGLVGRWLTKLESPATAFILLGVTP